MAKKSEIGQDDFENMLAWLDADKEAAGRKYELIRAVLIRIFITRGCSNLAEELADETIDRVVLKIQTLTQTYEGRPELYFYGVANKVMLEFLRKPKSSELPPALVAQTLAHGDSAQSSEVISDCLEKCLARLGNDQQNLVLGYYQYENHQKLEARRKLAAELKFSANALRIRAARVRTILRKCISACVENKSLG